jgi:hypothetical protein
MQVTSVAAFIATSTTGHGSFTVLPTEKQKEMTKLGNPYE